MSQDSQLYQEHFDKERNYHMLWCSLDIYYSLISLLTPCTKPSGQCKNYWLFHWAKRQKREVMKINNTCSYNKWPPKFQWLNKIRAYFLTHLKIFLLGQLSWAARLGDFPSIWSPHYFLGPQSPSLNLCIQVMWGHVSWEITKSRWQTKAQGPNPTLCLFLYGLHAKDGFQCSVVEKI